MDGSSNNHPTLFATPTDALGPPSLNEMSFGSGRTSYRDGTMDSTTQPSANASRISFADTRLGPIVQDSESMTRMEMVKDALAEIAEASSEEISAFVEKKYGVTIEPAFVPIFRATLKDKERTEQSRRGETT